MNNLNLTLDLVGALAIGYFVGFAYMKLKLTDKFEKDTKNLRELLNIKDSEYMTLKKDYRKEHRKRVKYENDIKELEEKLNKKSKQFNNLKGSISNLKMNIKTKNNQIRELESLLLDIQNDFTHINEALLKEKEYNHKLKIEFKQKIDELTQKANDLYMVKGTEELKNAKSIFNKLREESMRNI